MNVVQVAKIARRELLARVRSWSFVIVTVTFPVMMTLPALVAPFLLASTEAEVRVAVVDAGAGLGPRVVAVLDGGERPRIVAELVDADAFDDALRDDLNARVRTGAVDGYLVLEPGADAPAARYVSTETGNFELLSMMRYVVQQVAVGDLLAGTGVDPGAVRRLQRLRLETVALSDEGEREGGFELASLVTLALGMLLFTSLTTTGQGMALTIVEEKASRLIEVILGAVTASEFMAGKILGALGAGLIQLGVWVAAALAATLYLLPAVLLGAAGADIGLGALLRPELIVYFAVFFILGYALYSVLIAAVAATCTSAEGVGHAMLIPFMPLMMALMASLSVVANPGAELTRILSLIPFFTPITMLARVSVLPPPLWEIGLGVLLVLATTAAAIWTCARIFRYAILLTGKRPSVAELLRIVRAG